MEDYCEPIIDRETWARLQVQSEKARKRQPGRQGGWTKQVPMLSGMLYCAECGGPMYLYRRTSKGHLYERYYCEKSCFRGVYKDELESIVIEAVADALSPENIEAHRQYIPVLWEGSRQAEEFDQQRRTIRIGELTEQINNITDAIARGVQSEALFLKLETLEAEKRALLLPAEAAQTRDADELFAQVSHISASVRTLLLSDVPDATKKTALDLCVRSILVDASGKIRIDMLLPGLPLVGGSSGGAVSAPPEGGMEFLQRVRWLRW